MISRFFLRASRVTAAILVIGAATLAARAQDTPVYKSSFQRQLDRMDIGLLGVGQYTKTVSGTICGIQVKCYNLSESGSNTFGGLFQVRYTKSPYIGFEGGVGYARYTENFSSIIIGGAQTKVVEYSLGYVAHPNVQFFGVKPYAAAGLGTIAFTPTRNGGQGLPEQARMMYYYNVGVEVPAFTDWFAIRAGFRQKFFLAPDFGQNYLTILGHTTTTEPTVGFIFKF